MILKPDEDNSEPEEDEDEFYYSLNRSGAKKRDESFSAVSIGAIAGALLFAPLGVFGWILMLITIPLCAIIGAIVGACAVLLWNGFASRYLSRTDD